MGEPWVIEIYQIVKCEAETLAETPAVEDDPYVARLHVSGAFLPGSSMLPKFSCLWFAAPVHNTEHNMFCQCTPRSHHCLTYHSASSWDPVRTGDG